MTVNDSLLKYSLHAIRPQEGRRGCRTGRGGGPEQAAERRTTAWRQWCAREFWVVSEDGTSTSSTPTTASTDSFNEARFHSSSAATTTIAVQRAQLHPRARSMRQHLCQLPFHRLRSIHSNLSMIQRCQRATTIVAIG